MTGLRRRRDLALMPAIAWLLVQLAMTGLLSAPAQASAFAEDPGLTTVVICTPNGLEVIQLGDDGDASPSGAGGAECDWCQAFGTAPELAPPADGLPQRTDCKTFKFQIRAAALVARHGVQTGFLSRAPPL